MAFNSNPLSLSVPDPAFESWLRDNNFLQLLDHRTTQLHRQQPPSTPTPVPTITTTSAPATATSTAYVVIMSSVSSLLTLFSVLTINPFAKLCSDDFSKKTGDWCKGFFGSVTDYSFPASPDQGRMRVHENVKRFARNYATLFVLFFACTLYQMPISLLGLLSCLALWDMFRFCSDKWLHDRFPVVQQVLARIAQCVAAIILLFSNVQMALFFTVLVSYAAMILHASFRKLTPATIPSKGRLR